MSQTKSFQERYWAGQEQKLMSRHKAALKYIKEGPVLDIGCGDGLLLFELKKRGITGEGIGISEVAVKKCQERGLQGRVFDVSAGNFPYADESFKWVVMTDLLEHLFDPKKALKEAGRAGERVLFVVPNFNSLTARIQVLLGRVPENNTPRKGHVYWFNKAAIHKLLKDAGLRLISIESHTYKSDSVFAGIFKVLNKLAPGLFSLSFIVVASRNGNQG